MKHFYHVLINSLMASVTTNFVWFALIYWLYLGTQSVFATSVMTGIFLITNTVSGFWFGSIVDHHLKKTAMLISSLGTLFFFTLALSIYLVTPPENFTNLTNAPVWLLVWTVLLGVIAGGIRNIAVPTLTTLLVDEENRDKANGMIGMIMGISFSISSVASGFILGYAGMNWVLGFGASLTLLALIHLWFIPIPEKEIIHTHDKPKKLDIPGTIKIIAAVPGLFALIFFTTFNNFLGGVFMSLMDPYGLTLVSLQVWGSLWGVLSLGFIAGGLFISKYGLGKDPLKRLFLINIILWTDCILFTIQPSIVLLSIGMIVWIALMPFVEAIEHTIIQKVVPPERQGRVFGFAQSVETAASPITAFMIGPIAQFIFIPFMTTGRGVELIGSWFGVGPGRGIALVFMTAGVIGLGVTFIAMRSKAYVKLAERYAK